MNALPASVSEEVSLNISQQIVHTIEIPKCIYATVTSHNDDYAMPSCHSLVTFRSCFR